MLIYIFSLIFCFIEGLFIPTSISTVKHQSGFEIANQSSQQRHLIVRKHRNFYVWKVLRCKEFERRKHLRKIDCLVPILIECLKEALFIFVVVHAGCSSVSGEVPTESSRNITPLISKSNVRHCITSTHFVLNESLN